MELIDIVNTVLRNRGLKEIEQLTNDMHLRNDIGFESLDLAEFTARIEAEYDVDIFEDGIVNTIGEVLSKIAK